MLRALPPLLVGLLASGVLAAPPRVVVDPGHGGAQEGAVGQQGLLEKRLALSLAQRLKVALERRLGAHVSLTRTVDRELSLAERVRLANLAKPDVFVSLHANSMPTRKLRNRAQGIETFFLSASASGLEAGATADRENAESPHRGVPSSTDILAFILADLKRAEAHGDSSRLAYAVHKRLVEGTRAVDKGVQQAPFYVLMGVEAPAILVEVGFISHPEEGRRLGEAPYQQALADALAAGIEKFWADAEKRNGSAPTLSKN
ncbi:MAG: N-acetylmuramoyl-L-alanine amidase [Myxococcaceae bacterium]